MSISESTKNPLTVEEIAGYHPPHRAEC